MIVETIWQPLLCWVMSVGLLSIWKTFFFHKYRHLLHGYKNFVTSTDEATQVVSQVLFLVVHLCTLMFPLFNRPKLAAFWYTMRTNVEQLAQTGDGVERLTESFKDLKRNMRAQALLILFFPVLAYAMNIFGAFGPGVSQVENVSQSVSIIFALVGIIWVHNAFFHGSFTLWLSYLIRVQAICLDFICYRLKNQDTDVNIVLTESINGFFLVEDISEKFEKTYGSPLLLDFFYNGTIVTFYAYIAMNFVAGGNLPVVAFAILGIHMHGQRLFNVCAAAASFLDKMNELQHRMVLLRAKPSRLPPKICDAVSTP